MDKPKLEKAQEELKEAETKKQEMGKRISELEQLNEEIQGSLER